MRSSLAGAAVLLVHEPELGGPFADLARARLRGLGLLAAAHELGPAALESDRRGRAELEGALERLEGTAGVVPGRVGVLGFERGGTLAFLLGCARRLAGVALVEGRVLHEALSTERPIQPLELALNLEGELLGVFAQDGAVGSEERELLRASLTAAARPFELVVLPGARPRFFDPRSPQHDAPRAEELWRRVGAFLERVLAGGTD